MRAAWRAGSQPPTSADATPSRPKPSARRRVDVQRRHDAGEVAAAQVAGQPAQRRAASAVPSSRPSALPAVPSSAHSPAPAPALARGQTEHAEQRERRRRCATDSETTERPGTRRRTARPARARSGSRGRHATAATCAARPRRAATRAPAAGSARRCSSAARSGPAAAAGRCATAGRAGRASACAPAMSITSSGAPGAGTSPATCSACARGPELHVQQVAGGGAELCTRAGVQEHACRVQRRQPGTAVGDAWQQRRRDRCDAQRIDAEHAHADARAAVARRERVELDHRAGQRHAVGRGDPFEQRVVEAVALRTQAQVGFAVDAAQCSARTRPAPNG